MTLLPVRPLHSPRGTLLLQHLVALAQGPMAPPRAPGTLLWGPHQFTARHRARGPKPGRVSAYGLQLRERRKLALVYGGLATRYMTRLLSWAQGVPGYWAPAMLHALETRVDVVVYRSGWAWSMAMARQLVAHGGVQVNGQVVTVPSALLSPGDLVRLTPRAHGRVARHLGGRAGGYPRSRRPVSPRPGEGSVLALVHGVCAALWTGGPAMRPRPVPAWHATPLAPVGDMARTLYHVRGSEGLVSPRYPSAPCLPPAPHLEVNHRTGTLILLYPPQRVAYPCLLDMDAVARGL